MAGTASGTLGVGITIEASCTASPADSLADRRLSSDSATASQVHVACNGAPYAESASDDTAEGGPSAAGPGRKPSAVVGETRTAELGPGLITITY